MTISLCMMVHNDLPILRATLIHELRWVDQLCILDLGSTDGTWDFLRAVKRPQDVIARREVNTIPELGFSEARNATADLASGDWLYFTGANCCMSWTFPRETIRDRIACKWASQPSPVLSINTFNFESNALPAHQLEQICNFGHRTTESHRVLIRRNSGVVHKGYIHEEPYLEDLNCYEMEEPTGLMRFHFAGMGNSDLRQCRYAWMLRRAIRNPDLQKWTNSWWYHTLWPRDKAVLEPMADRYEAMKLPELAFLST